MRNHAALNASHVAAWLALSSCRYDYANSEPLPRAGTVFAIGFDSAGAAKMELRLSAALTAGFTSFRPTVRSSLTDS